MKIRYFLPLLLCVCVFAQNPGGSHGYGVFYAANYAYGSASIQGDRLASGTDVATLSSVTIYSSTVALPDGRVIVPFSTNTPLIIGQGDSQETITPISVVGCYSGAANGSCTLVANFTKTHTQGEAVASASFGLQEAINDATSGGGGSVVVDKNWLGTTAQITSAAGNATVEIKDLRSGLEIDYLWNTTSSTYVATSAQLLGICTSNPTTNTCPVVSGVQTCSLMNSVAANGNTQAVMCYNPITGTPFIPSNVCIAGSTGCPQGGPASLTCTPASISFGNQTQGTSSTPSQESCVNDGLVPILINSVSVGTSNFAITSNNCPSAPSTLAPGSSCQIGVSFVPQTTGALADNLTISNSSAQPNIQIPLTGTGTATVVTTWSSSALSPLTPTITIPNTQQESNILTPSAGATVDGTKSSYWNANGQSGGSGGSFAIVNHNITTAIAVAANATRSCASMNVTSGDVIGIISRGYNGPTFSGITVPATDTQGNTYTNLALKTSNTGASMIAFSFVKTGTTGADTVSVTATGGNIAYLGVECFELSGNAASPADVNGSSAATFNTGSMTVSTSSATTVANDACIAAFADSASSGAPTAGVGFTPIDTDSGYRFISEYQFNVPNGTTLQGTASENPGSSSWTGYIACFKPAASIGSPIASVDNFGSATPGLVHALVAGSSTITAQGGTPAQITNPFFNASAASGTVVFANPQTSGNTNAVAISWGDATSTVSTVVDSAGNTYNCNAPKQANSLSVEICPASPIKPYANPQGNTVTVTMSGTVPNLNISGIEYNYTVASSLVDGSVVNSTGASGPATASITTTNANDIVISAIGLAQMPSAVQQPFTNETPNGTNLFILDTPAYATGTFTPTATLTGGAWVQQTEALKVVANTTVATINSQAVSNVYYMAPSNASPPGSDGNACTSQNAPCLTFTRIAALLKAGIGANGSTVFLEPGTYGKSTGTGFPNFNCGTGGNVPSGTSSANVTWQSLTPRLAWIKGDGTQIPFLYQNCAYWNIVGLQISDADSSASYIQNQDGALDGVNVSNGTISDNLIHHSNRCGNIHLIALTYGSNNMKVWRNETYFHHRHGIMAFRANSIDMWLNYDNGENDQYPLLSCYQPPSGKDGDGFINYGAGNGPSNPNVVRDSIADNEPRAGFVNQTTSGQAASGNIDAGLFGFGISSVSGACFRNAGHPGDGVYANNNTFKDGVCVLPGTDGGWNRCGTGTTFKNLSVLGGITSQLNGFEVDNFSSECDGTSSATGSLLFVQNFTGGDALAVGSGTGSQTFTVTDLHSWQNGGTVRGGQNIVTRLYQTNPLMGTCYAWIPTGSPLLTEAGAGVVGGQFLFEHDNTGTITSTPVWHQNGSFVGQGAIVSGGVNDPNVNPGHTLADFNNRANINTNGCSFPSGYSPAP